MIDALAPAYRRATARNSVGEMPQIGDMASGVQAATFAFRLVKAFCALIDEFLINQVFFDDDVQQGIEQCHVAVGFELQKMGGMPGQV